jgi:hypothetical protein
VPAAPRKPGTSNLLGPKSLVASDGELEADGRLAQNLVDPAATKPWCSSPNSARGRSKRFFFDLVAAQDVARVAFDDALPEEAGFEGSAAKDVVVLGSSESSHGPWKELGRTTLERGKNDQALDLPANDTHWLRVDVLSNHGHPTLTQLLKVRAFANDASGTPTPAAPRANVTDEGPFRVERLRLSREEKGTALEPAVFAPGETFWVYFKPRALRLDIDGNYWIGVDMKLEDAQGNEKMSWPAIVDSRSKSAKLTLFVSFKVELPKNFPAGNYAVRLDVKDKLSEAAVDERVPFEVKKAR